MEFEVNRDIVVSALCGESSAVVTWSVSEASRHDWPLASSGTVRPRFLRLATVRLRPSRVHGWIAFVVESLLPLHFSNGLVDLKKEGLDSGF